MILVVSEKLPSPSRLEHLQDKSIVIVNVNPLLINGQPKMESSLAIAKRKFNILIFKDYLEIFYF